MAFLLRSLVARSAASALGNPNVGFTAARMTPILYRSYTSKPKRPLSPYILFVQAQARQGEKSVSKSGEAWAGLSDEEKEVYVHHFNLNKKEYDLAWKAWEDSAVLPPKGPKTSYIIFFQELLKGDSTGTIQERAAEAAKKWGNLNDEDKAKYKALAEQEKERVKQEKLDWERAVGQENLDKMKKVEEDINTLKATKYPTTPLNVFKIAKAKKHKAFKDLDKKAAEYKNLSADEREPFIQKAKYHTKKLQKERIALLEKHHVLQYTSFALRK